MNLPKLIAILGICAATALALYPRWDRTWTQGQTVHLANTPDYMDGWGKSERRDVVRHWMMNDPPAPDPAPSEVRGQQTITYRVLEHAAHVELGRTLLEWFLVAVPALLIAVILSQRPAAARRADSL